MTKLLIVIAMTMICFGQSEATSPAESEPKGEVSLWAQDGGNLAPWIFYSGKRMTAEVRYNWDDKGVVGACIGKAFGTDALTLIPEACGYSGKFSGYGPELWINSDTKKFFLSSYVQYAKMKGTTSYGYVWFQSDYKIHKNLGIGLGAQSLKDGKEASSADFGLSIVFRTEKFYINGLPLWRATSEKRGEFTSYVGIGLVF